MTIKLKRAAEEQSIYTIWNKVKSKVKRYKRQVV